MFFYDYYLLCIFIFALFVVFVAAVILIARAVQLGSVREKQKEINDKAKKYLSDKWFSMSKIFYIIDNASFNHEKNCKKFLGVDSENKKVALVDYEKGSVSIADFSDILNYEIYENGSLVTIGGGTGGYFSGIAAAESSKKCKEYKLMIRLKKFDNPHIAYNIVADIPLNFGVDKNSPEFKASINSIQEVISFLEVVKNENQNKTEEKKQA